ncbi:MAG: ATP-binding protein [Myxococcales bacterium]|nr:ATP-binding protein [Myxococcales bacterium]
MADSSEDGTGTTMAETGREVAQLTAVGVKTVQPQLEHFSARVLVSFALLDIGFQPLIASGFSFMVGVDSESFFGPGTWHFMRAGMVGTLLWVAVAWRMLAPVQAWLRTANAGAGQNGLQYAARHVARLPFWLGALWVLKWVAHVVFLLLMHDLVWTWTQALFVMGVCLAPWPLAHAFGTWIVAPAQRAVWAVAPANLAVPTGAGETLRSELVMYGTGLSLGPAFYLASLALAALDNGAPEDALYAQLVVYLVLVVIYAPLCSALLAATIHAPLRRLLASTRQIAGQASFLRTTAIPVERHGEIGELVQVSNWMVKRVARAEEERAAQSEKLAEANDSLERRVQERTVELKARMQELQQTQVAMMSMAHQAGMAEVATGVLHNVGNALNSVNVSLGCLRELTSTGDSGTMARAVQLLVGQDDPAKFLAEDPRGTTTLKVLRLAADEGVRCQAQLVQEIERLARHVGRIEVSVSRQQAVARVNPVVERRCLTELVGEAVDMVSASCDRHQIELLCECESGVDIVTDGHKVVGILVNLLANAIDAVKPQSEERRRITIEAKRRDSALVFAVRDSGDGIAQDKLASVFQYGFTTKAHGHGFGLHTSACSARQLGGQLAVDSAGEGQGATFSLILPTTLPEALDNSNGPASMRVPSARAKAS